MRLQIFIQDFNSCDKRLSSLRNYEIIFVDSSVLLHMFYESFYQKKLETIVLLFSEWRKRRFSEILCVPDFIELEAMNAERFYYGNRKVRRFLKNLKASELGFYIELRTPIKRVKAENRSIYLDLLSKKFRHIIIKKYKELSGTDIAMLVSALFLNKHKIATAIVSFDRTLLQAAEELGITPYEVDVLCKKLTGIYK